MKLQEDLFGIVGTETIQISSGNFYCLLVLEIDLSKESTKEIFNQVSFKILTSSTAYPSLTQQDINRINGSNKLYQLEFARFKTSANGITDFQDKRTFLNFNSIYAEIEQHIQDIDSGALYIQKSDIAIVQGTINSSDTYVSIRYPNGFYFDNCVILSVLGGNSDFAMSTALDRDTDVLPEGCNGLRATMQPDNIVIERAKQKSTSIPAFNTNYKLVLLKISEEMFH